MDFIILHLLGAFERGDPLLTKDVSQQRAVKTWEAIQENEKPAEACYEIDRTSKDEEDGK